MNKKIHITAIIPAAGVGKRMQADRPKQYMELAGQTILQHTVKRIGALPFVSHVVVVTSPDDGYFPSVDFDCARLTRVDGGTERADSVLNALKSLEESAEHWVLVHDAARPLVCSDDITRLVETCLAKKEGGILACRVKDTIKRGEDTVLETVPREQLWQALTPQFFPLLQLKEALQRALACGAPVTDEASAIEWAKGTVHLITGRSDNIKITNPEDVDLAAFLLARQEEAS